MNWFKRLPLVILTTLLLFVALPATITAQSAETSTFDVGLRLYENGSYSEAAALFQQLVDAGYDDSRLYHNLGSAMHKQGAYGEAIVNYRRALELAPRSRDTRANLELARDRVVDQFNRSDVGLFETLTQLSNWLTLTEVAVIALLLWFAWTFAWLRYRRASTERQRTAMQSALIGITALLALLLLAGINRYNKSVSRPVAVVVADEVPVTEFPAGANELFVLHDGAEIEVVERQAGWVKLTLPGDALQGWVSAETLAFVDQNQP